MNEIASLPSSERQAVFNYSWVDYEALTPADLQLVPADERTADWRADYQAMRLMFFRDPPVFDDILSGLKSVEEELRQH